MSFTLNEGETLAIVGESGSGKSVASKAIMGILAENGKVTDGSILYTKENGEEIDLAKLSERDYHQIRGKRNAMVFQDPMTSLNPTMTIGRQIMEPIIKHQGCTKAEAKLKAEELISLSELQMQLQRMKQYPHQFSGGMRQRIVLRLTLACNPRVLICDEPTTALDVTIQAQILELIKDLQQKTNVAVIFITLT